MKYLLTTILLFITINCFAIDQNLIEGAKEYDKAIANLHKILEVINTDSMSLDEFIDELHKTTDSNLSIADREAAKSKIDEKHKRSYELNLQYAKVEAIVKKLEPLKKEYDKQKELEDEHKELIESIIVTMVVSILIAIFGTVIYFVITQQKKYWKLLKSGKITQEEYDRLTRSSVSSSNNNMGVNPATGLPMTGIGISDVGGNVKGSSSISSTFDYSQDYSSRHRWD